MMIINSTVLFHLIYCYLHIQGLGKQLAAAAGASKFQTMRVLLWDKGETKLQVSPSFH